MNYKEYHLFISVGIEENVKTQSDCVFDITESNEGDGFIVSPTVQRNNKIVNVKETKLIGTSKEAVDFDKHPLVLEIVVPIHEDIPFNWIWFSIVKAKKDGFILKVGMKPSGMNWDTIDKEGVYIKGIYAQFEKPKANKVFVFSFPGEYNMGCGYVIAPDQKSAFQLAKSEIESNGFNGKFKLEDVRELNLKNAEAVIQYDGHLS